MRVRFPSSAFCCLLGLWDDPMKSRRLICQVKNYPWGGHSYLESLLNVKSDEPYAELWMGTHDRGLSKLESGESLLDYLKENNEKALPFLFKVLSIEKPLSIQCHPDKEFALSGYKRGIFGDFSEKRELLLSLDEVRALIGFNDIDEAVENLRRIIPKSYEAYLKGKTESIESLVFALLFLDSDEKRALLEEMALSLKSFSSPLDRDRNTLYVLQNNPDDIGSIFPQIMNNVLLRKGECYMMEPRIVHAYLSGNALELTDPSDNVIRIALTGKEKNLDEFRDMALLERSYPKKLASLSENGITTYISPIDEFSLGRADGSIGSFDPKRATIAIFLNGGAEIREGDESLSVDKGSVVLFLPSDENISIVADSAFYFARALR